MSRKLLSTTASLAVALTMATFSVASSSAAGIVIGAPGDPNQGNCFPFGCTYTPSQYQQVYSSSAFTGPININEISFYNHNYADGIVNSGTYTISLSTTSASVYSLSSTFSANLGADNTTVFNGSLPALTGGVGGQLNIFLGSSFSYDPSMGNLLLNVNVGSITNSSSYAYLDVVTGSGLVSRNYGGNVDTDYGLVTGFDVATSAVPEPTTWAMMLVGFAGLGFAGMRASRKGSVAA